MQWYKLMISIFDLVEIFPLLDLTQHYHIQFWIFGEVHKIKLKIKKTISNWIPFVPINQSLLFYFFIEKRSDLETFLKIHSILEIELVKDQEIIAKAKLSVKDFWNPDVNQKVFYEIMPGVNM